MSFVDAQGCIRQAQPPQCRQHQTMKSDHEDEVAVLGARADVQAAPGNARARDRRRLVREHAPRPQQAAQHGAARAHVVLQRPGVPHVGRQAVAVRAALRPSKPMAVYVRVRTLQRPGVVQCNYEVPSARSPQTC